jgi:hypothetical protein
MPGIIAFVIFSFMTAWGEVLFATSGRNTPTRGAETLSGSPCARPSSAARGADWIPTDSFVGAIPHERYENLISAARDANMNKLCSATLWVF